MPAVRILHDLGALATLGAGLYAIARPLPAARLLGLASGAAGRAGWRAMGGFVAGYVAFAIYTGEALIYAAFAAAGIAAFAAGLAAALLDDFHLLLRWLRGKAAGPIRDVSGNAGLRAVGGFAAGLGAFALFYAGEPLLYSAIGAAWLAAAAVHLFSAARDPGAFRLYAVAASEATCAVLLLLHDG